MKVKIENIIHHRGDALLDTFEYKAYLALLKEKKVTKARKILTDNHYATYWTGERNITTGEYVRALYKEKGLQFPGSLTAASKEIVKEAIKRRVNDEINHAKDIAANGCNILPRGRREGNIMRLFDGHNRAAAMAALGSKEIEVAC